MRLYRPVGGAPGWHPTGDDTRNVCDYIALANLRPAGETIPGVADGGKYYTSSTVSPDWDMEPRDIINVSGAIVYLDPINSNVYVFNLQEKLLYMRVEYSGPGTVAMIGDLSNAASWHKSIVGIDNPTWGPGY